jgi:hypothetical protein
MLSFAKNWTGSLLRDCRAPSAIAVVIIGGQSLCFLLTLLAIPMLYTILDDIFSFRRKGARPGAQESQ